jgi:hypothetical protein
MVNNFPLGRRGLLSLVIVCVLAASAFFLLRKPHTQTENQATAVGLRGTSRISKNLSPFQEKKLKKHFLDTPPVAHAPAGHTDVRSEVNAINQFNQRQRP